MLIKASDRARSISRLAGAVLLLMLMIALLAACGSNEVPAPEKTSPAAPLVAATPAGQESPAPTPTPADQPEPAGVPAPTSTPLPSETEPAVDTDSLLALAQAGLPADAFEGLDVLPLAGDPPLWAVHSTGLRNFNLEPVSGHFLAIYKPDASVESGWLELARVDLDAPPANEAYGYGPDYLFENGVQQVAVAPGRIWLQVEGGVGAHSGVFQLFSFDGHDLRQEVAGSAASPGLGAIRDLNGDGQAEVILDVSDRYVFCYACGVSRPAFQVYTWDAANEQMLEVSIQPMLMGQQGHPAREPNNQAVSFAEAGLWNDALQAIGDAQAAAAEADEPTDLFVLDWNAALIKLYQQAHTEATETSVFPLINYVFAGDYAGAVDLLRVYPVNELFSPETPVIQGTVAQGWEDVVSNTIIERSNAALALQPGLAPAYFLRGWAEFLAAPPDPQVRVDLHMAAQLAPADPLFAAVATLNPGPDPTVASKGFDSDVSHLQFASGETSAMVGGGLVAGGYHHYQFRALAGQTLRAVVQSPTDGVYITVAGVDGTVLAPAGDALREWSGQLPATEDYVVTVRSIGSGTGFTLTITIPPLE